MKTNEIVTLQVFKPYFIIFLSFCVVMLFLNIFQDLPPIPIYPLVNLVILILLGIIGWNIYRDKGIRTKFQQAQFSDPLWINIIMYFYFFTLSFSFVSILLPYPNDIDSFIGSLLQAQAAIIAIVFSLSIVILEINSQHYPSRITDAYKTYPDIWILLIIFTFSMSLNLIISASSNFQIFGYDLKSSFEYALLILGIFSFSALFPYLWNFFNILRIENTIGRIAYMINSSPNIEDFWRDDYPRIQALFDVIMQSIHQHDYATIEITYNRIMELTKRINENINNIETFQNDDRIKAIKQLHDGTKKFIKKDEMPEIIFEKITRAITELEGIINP